MTKGVGSGSGPWSVPARRERRRPGCARAGGRRRRPPPSRGAASRSGASATSFADSCGDTVTTSSSSRSADIRVSASARSASRTSSMVTSPTRQPSESTTATASRSTSWLRASAEPVGYLLHLFARLRGDQGGGHDAAGLVLLVAEELTQLERRPRRDVAEDLGPDGQGQVAQRVDRLVGLHGSQQARRLHRVRLAQQLFEVLGLHLLEGVGRLVRAECGKQLAAFVTAQVLEQVGQLARAKPVQAFVGRVEAHGGRRVLRSVGSLKGWMAAQSMTRSGVGRGRHRRGPRRRSRVAVETSAPTRRMRPRTSAR